jgi:hypothetical protein
MKLTTPEVPGSNAEFQLVDGRIFHRREQRAGFELAEKQERGIRLGVHVHSGDASDES